MIKTTLVTYNICRPIFFALGDVVPYGDHLENSLQSRGTICIDHGLPSVRSNH